VKKPVEAFTAYQVSYEEKPVERPKEVKLDYKQFNRNANDFLAQKDDYNSYTFQK
jgi:hypothetical protein